MANTFLIRAVHLERAPGATHDHIARVRLVGFPDSQDYSRAKIIAAINLGDIFFTNESPPARVIVHPCPVCSSYDYITTEPDYTTQNNLLSLPKY
jgi:hypothetical protein